MIRLGEILVDFFSASVGIHISLYFVYWVLLHLPKGILSVFFFLLAWQTLLIDYFQTVRMF